MSNFQLEPCSTRRHRPQTNPPASLKPHELLHLQEWAEARAPWISRGALGCYTTLECYTEECLDWYRAKGRRQADWVATVQGWIRRDERKRLTAMAQSGSDSAKLALRDPEKWKTLHDRGERAERESRALKLVRPNPGQTGKAISLTRSSN